FRGNFNGGFQDGSFGGGAFEPVKQPDFNAALGEQLVCEDSEGGSDFRQDAVPGVNQNAPNLFIAKARKIAFHVMNEVTQFGDHFDTRKSAAGNDKGEQLLAKLRVLFEFRFFQDVNQMAAQAQRVGQGAERLRVLEQAGLAGIVRRSAEGDHQIVV